MEFCTFASGSSGNCAFVTDGRTHILIDAGINRKQIVKNLEEIGVSPKELSAVLITHEHTDHTKGIRVFSREYGIPVYATKGTQQAMLSDPALDGLPKDLFVTVQRDEGFSLGGLSVRPIPLSHDAADPVGYCLKSEKKKLAFLTDLGAFSEKTAAVLSGVDALLLEANHDVAMLQVGPYPYVLKQRIAGNKGHLSNEAAGELLNHILHPNIRHIVLGHLSRENNMPELALETVRLCVTMADNAYTGGDLPLYVADRKKRGRVLSV